MNVKNLLRIAWLTTRMEDGIFSRCVTALTWIKNEEKNKNITLFFIWYMYCYNNKEYFLLFSIIFSTTILRLLIIIAVILSMPLVLIILHYFHAHIVATLKILIFIHSVCLKYFLLKIFFIELFYMLLAKLVNAKSTF